MPAQGLFPVAVFGAIATVSAAGLAAGTHLRHSLHEGSKSRSLVGTAVERGGAASGGAQRDGLATRKGTERAAADAGEDLAPTFSRIVIERSGVSRFEGRGTPGSQVLIDAAGRVIGAAIVNSDGRWLVTLSGSAISGEYRIGSAVAGRMGIVHGDDVRIFVPADFRGAAIVAYDAPQRARVHLAGGDGSAATRTAAERLARDASEKFDEVLTGMQGAEGSARDRESGGGTESGFAAPVLEWVQRAAATYHETVTRRLRAETGTQEGLAQEAGGPPSGRESRHEKDPGEVRVAGEETSDGIGSIVQSILDRIRAWLDESAKIYDQEIARPLSVPRSDGKAAVSEEDVADGRSAAPREGPSQEERQRKAAAKAAEDARRYAEERRKAEETWKRVKEKDEETANGADSRRQAEEVLRRKAEEDERQKRAAEESQRRTAETEQRLENNLKRLEEAQKAEAARKTAELARQDYAQRRRQAEEQAARAAKDAETLAAAERDRVRRMAEAKEVAAKAEQEAQARKAREVERERQKQAALEAEKAKEEEAKRKAGETEAKRKVAEDEEDARREEEEYRVFRKMLADAKRKEQEGLQQAEEESPSVSRAKEAAADASALERPSAKVGSWKRKSAAAGHRKACKTKGSSRKARRSGYHLVKHSDTLWGLARRYYGAGRRYEVIYRANRGRISHPDVLRPCLWIRIPGLGRH
jgi:nucleoid-associated protein YgaU